MGLVATVLVLALALGLARGGRLEALAHVRLHCLLPLAGAVAAQVAAVLASGAPRVALYALSTCLAAWVVAHNLSLPGLPLVGLGLLLNLAVVTANAAMPVSLHAAARAGVSSSEVASLRTGNQPGHEPADRRTRFAALADVVPVASPLHREVVSIGDVCVAAGLALYVSVALGHRAPRRAPRWMTRVSESTTRGSYS